MKRRFTIAIFLRPSPTCFKEHCAFPGVVIPITVGRDRSIRLIKEAHKKKLAIGVVSQKILTSKFLLETI